MPSWHVRNRGWVNHNGNFHKPRNVKYAFVWPNDKQKGWWGRLGDIATNKGPDIFITANANRTPTAADGPSRRRWTGFPHLETNRYTRLNDANSWLGNFPGTGAGFTRNRRPYYDHRTRRYRKYHDEELWTDVERNLDNPNHFNAIETWPWGWQGIRSVYEDPKNVYRANGVSYGAYGEGGYADPIINGIPPEVQFPGELWPEIP